MSDDASCIDLVVEPSLEGGRLLAVEHSPSKAREHVHAALRAAGWTRRWLRPEHYASTHAASWVRRSFWHPSRLELMSSDEPDADGTRGRVRRNVRSRIRSHTSASKASPSARGVSGADGGGGVGNYSSYGLRGWHKPSFQAEDVVLLQHACEQAALQLRSLHLLTADRQQTLPISMLRLWPSRARLALERRSRSPLAIPSPLAISSPCGPYPGSCHPRSYPHPSPVQIQLPPRGRSPHHLRHYAGAPPPYPRSFASAITCALALALSAALTLALPLIPSPSSPDPCDVAGASRNARAPAAPAGRANTSGCGRGGGRSTAG